MFDVMRLLLYGLILIAINNKVFFYIAPRLALCILILSLA